MSTIEILSITPAMAREFLKRNTDNRPLRMGHVMSLREAMLRGEWGETHQGIAFDVEGVLADGQHRLTALSLIEDPEFSIEMPVWTGLPKAAFVRIDNGMKTRSTSDVLRIGKEVAQTANFLAEICMSNAKAHPTPQQAKPYCDFIAPMIDRLLVNCTYLSKTWSSSAVRAAVMVSMMRGHGDYAMSVYRALVTAKFDEMPPIAQSIFRQYLNGSVRGRGGRDLFVRCVKVFDPLYARTTRVQINDQQRVLEEVREEFAAALAEQAKPKKKAPAMEAKVVSVKRGQVYRAAAH